MNHMSIDGDDVFTGVTFSIKLHQWWGFDVFLVRGSPKASRREVGNLGPLRLRVDCLNDIVPEGLERYSIMLGGSDAASPYHIVSLLGSCCRYCLLLWCLAMSPLWVRWLGGWVLHKGLVFVTFTKVLR